MHRYVGDVWMVPHARDRKLATATSENVLGVLFVPLSMIPIIGWLVAGIWLFPIWLNRRAVKRRLLRHLEGELTDPKRPWAWTMRREGPHPWPYVNAPYETAQSLGLRSPARDGDLYVVEQIERTKDGAIAAATRAVNLLT
jgi:hypothetical protein